MKVVIFIGSKSDFPILKEALEILKRFDIPFALELTSAHRSPDRTERLIKDYEEHGTEIFIAVAGMAAHLAATVAAHSIRPVIGVPVEGASLNGLDALLSTVQMPRGIPVACMGLGKAGAVNAVLLAVQILSLKDSSLRAKVKEYRQKMASQIEMDSKKIVEKL